MKMYKLIICFLAMGVLGMGTTVKGDDVSCKLEVRTLPDSCRFTLIIKNNLKSEVILQFHTSQQYDFIVKKDSGEVVWQWSFGLMFTQAFTQLILKPREEKRFSEEHSFSSGEYSAQGILTATPEKKYTELVKFSVSQDQTSVLRGKITKILDNLYFFSDDHVIYLIENPTEELKSLQGKTIEVTSYQAEPIPGTIDKKIIIEKYEGE